MPHDKKIDMRTCTIIKLEGSRAATEETSHCVEQTAHALWWNENAKRVTTIFTTASASPLHTRPTNTKTVSRYVKAHQTTRSTCPGTEKAREFPLKPPERKPKVQRELMPPVEDPHLLSFLEQCVRLGKRKTNLQPCLTMPSS